jgi:hypothetical protein
MGYGFTNEKILKYNVEFNLNYIYNRKNFVLKAKTGLCPFTYFGNYYNASLLLGLSTKMDRVFSYYFLAGPNLFSANKNHSEFYEPATGFFIGLNTGVIFKPKFSDKLFFGIETETEPQFYYSKSNKGYYLKKQFFVLRPNFGILYKF